MVALIVSHTRGHETNVCMMTLTFNVDTPGYSTTLSSYQSSASTSLSPYIAYYPTASSDPESDPAFVWPHNPGSNSLPVIPENSGSNSAQGYHSSHRHSAPSALSTVGSNPGVWQQPQVQLQHRLYQHSHQNQRLQPSQRIEPSGGFQLHAPSSQSLLEEDRRLAGRSANLRWPMGSGTQNYPSPHSDVSRDETRSSCVSVLPSNNVSPNIMFTASPSTASHISHPESSRKSQEPPRNATGQITCSHPTCESKPNPPVFSRKCEWTKHMDKHTRPYVCDLPGCEKISGFTYSGGLRRHQREVHGQHGGPKAPCMCPHKDCKRSTGAGFSRKENLLEHLRRVHRTVGAAETEQDLKRESSPPASREHRKRRRRFNDDEEDEIQSVSHEPKKRRRHRVEDDESGEDEDESLDHDLEAQVKRLRKEIQEKDERLKRLEQTVEKLTRGETK